MPSVQLERLRPQINAIITQYENSDMFTRSLISLLKSYSGDIDRNPSQVECPASCIESIGNLTETCCPHIPISNQVNCRKTLGTTIFRNKKDCPDLIV